MKQAAEISIKNRFIHLCRKYPSVFTYPALQSMVFGESFRVVGAGGYFDAVMRSVGRAPTNSYQSYVAELLANKPLRAIFESSMAKGLIPNKGRPYDDRFLSEANVVHYYALIRELEPQIVVETGTAAGSMTSWVLAALDMNKSGKLISIDLPSIDGALTMDMTVEDAGFLIPTEYRQQWELLAGDAKILLPQVMLDNEVDVFIHDSLHTRTHMLFEYNVARALLKEGAVILSDDILWNKSWFSFLESHDLRGMACSASPTLGFAVNTFDKYEKSIGVGPVR